MKNRNRRGFTLIELLVVIAIIAVLAVVVILSLNPAELLRQARDSNRISDMGTIKSSLALYLADQTSPVLASSTAGYNFAYLSTSTPGSEATGSIGFATLGNPPVAASTTMNPVATAATLRNIDSTGWIPVSFNLISGGSPMPQLPVDPANNGTYYYGYVATSSSGFTYKITMRTESTKFSNVNGVAGGSDVEGTDGGLFPSVYEAGTNLKL